MLETHIEDFILTVKAIARSPAVEEYLIGFTSKSLRERFRPYRKNDYEHIVALCDRLTRAEALELEKRLWSEATKNKKSVLYKKFEKTRRGKKYRASYGGRGNPDEPVHTVYMVWWRPYL